MNKYTVSLALEELAVALGLAGSPETAKGLLLSNYAEMNSDEERGRLLAANHSLMARNLLTLKEEPSLDKNLTQVIRFIFQNDFILRLSKGSGETEQLHTFYFRKAQIVGHEIDRGVVHHLSSGLSPDDFIAKSLNFYDLSRAKSKQPGVVIPYKVLEEARAAAPSGPARILAILEKAGITTSVSTPLTEDFTQPSYRGSVMRVDYEKNKLVSNRGFLVLRGKARTWLFTIFEKDKEPYVKVFIGTSDVFQQELRALL